MARRRSTVLTGKAMYLTGDTYEGTFVEGLRAGDTNEVQIAERIYCGATCTQMFFIRMTFQVDKIW